MHKISIIIPIYNVEKYLSKCIDSLLNQTYKNIEIILVDDDSPDSCPEICDKYAKQDKRIVVIHKKNGGVSSARNEGLRVASGDYIGFVDPDDFVDPTMYEKLYNKIIEDTSDMSMCRFKYVYDDREIFVCENFFKNINASNIKEYFTLVGDTKKGNYIFTNNVMGNIWRCLYSKNLIKNKYFDEDLSLCEDLMFNINVINEDTKISLVDEYLYFYYQRQNSIMKIFNEKKYESYKNYVNKILIALENQIDDKYFKSYKFLVYVLGVNIIIRSKSNYLKNKFFNDKYFISLNSKENYRATKKMKLTIKYKIAYFLIFNKFFRLYEFIFQKLSRKNRS